MARGDGYLAAAARFSARNAAAKREAAPRRAAKRQSRESQIQCALVRRCRLVEQRYPPLRALHAIPNGAYIAPVQDPVTGEWRRPHAEILKAEGLRAGVFDLLLAWPSACGRYHGLYLETKAPGGRLSDSQQDWRELMSEAGYACEVYTDPEAGFSDLMQYLGLLTLKPPERF